MYALFRSLLFALPPEQAHRVAMIGLDYTTSLPLLRTACRQLFCLEAPGLRRKYMGLTFANPVGLAAGFDKNGCYLDALACLGFGFIEVGTVTPRPQAGNPPPRLFRLPVDQALINRMGFNNEGVEALARRLQRWNERLQGEPRPIVGINIGKNKDTPNERAHEDYLTCFRALALWADYFTINVSSPNTPGLRELQGKEPLLRLLDAIQEVNNRLNRPKPILLKIAPDLTHDQLDEIAAVAKQAQLNGLIATNTTLSRTGLRTPSSRLEAIGAGGLSGAPLRQRATEVIRYLRQRLDQKILLIGVGGIDSPQAAQEKFQAGADLIQIYTGLIYKGPGLIRKILQGVQDNAQ